MKTCHVCGKEASVVATIEGAEVNVCEKCSKMGRVLGRIKTEETKKKPKTPSIIEVKPETEETVVRNYAERIRNAREKSGLTQEEFANALNEKLSVVRNAEQGKLVPDIKLAKKIEVKYGIKLVEIQQEEKLKTSAEFSGTPTLGDIIQVKRRKK